MPNQLALQLPATRGGSSYELADWDSSTRSFSVLASTRAPLLCSEWNEREQKLVSYYESLESWDLTTRYAKSPLVLDQHMAGEMSGDSVIGTGEDVKETDQGLVMRVRLASLNANERTAKIEARIKEGLLRGVSVGWDYGRREDDVYQGLPWRRYYNNKLTELSVCTIPKDPDALIAADNRTDEQKRADTLSAAGRNLALGRRQARQGDAHEIETVFDTGGSIGKAERTPAGGLRIPARITRTGVFVYKKAGKTIRQLRLPEEVFNTDSLRSLQSAPITDLRFHNGFITPATWKDAALGHTEGIKRDGKYVAGDIIVSDGKAVADVENGHLHDLSAGYRCWHEWTSGTYDGEPYDCIQRDIRYNHVALLPKGMGRAGTDVALLMDAASVEITDEEPMGEPQTITKTIINFDGHDFEYGSKEHVGAITKHYDARIVSLEGKNTELQANFDKANGKVEAAERAEKAAKEEAEKEKCGWKARLKSRMKLIQRVRALFESEDEEDDKAKEEEKMDAMLDMTDRALMELAIKKDEQYGDKFLADAKDKSDGYIEGIFEGLEKRGIKRDDGIDSVVRKAEKAKLFDSRNSAEGPYELALKKKAEREKTSGLGPLAVTKQTA